MALKLFGIENGTLSNINKILFSFFVILLFLTFILGYFVFNSKADMPILVSPPAGEYNQETGSVTGRVTFASSPAGVSYAYIAIINAYNINEAYYTTTSDANGNYKFTGIMNTLLSNGKPSDKYIIYANNGAGEGYSLPFSIEPKGTAATSVVIYPFTGEYYNAGKGSLTGRVTLSNSTAGLPSATIEVCNALNPSEIFATTSTDEYGFYQVVGLQNTLSGEQFLKPYIIHVTHEIGSGYSNKFGILENRTTLTAATAIIPGPSGTGTGIVVGKVTPTNSTLGVKFARISLRDSSDHDFEYFSTLADNNGYFMMSGIPSSVDINGNLENKYIILASDDFYGRGWSNSFGIEPDGTNVASSILYPLSANIMLASERNNIFADNSDHATISAYVTDSTGMPVADGKIVHFSLENTDTDMGLLNHEPDSGYGESTMVTTVTSGGYARIEAGWAGISGAKNKINAYLDENPSISSSIQVYYVPKISSCSGSVVDTNGNAIGGQLITLHLMSTGSEIYSMNTVTSNEQPYAGSFTFDNIVIASGIDNAYISMDVIIDSTRYYGESQNFPISNSKTSIGSIVIEPYSGYGSTASCKGIVVDSFNSGYGGVPVTLHILDNSLLEISTLTVSASGGLPYTGAFEFDNIDLSTGGTYGYVSADVMISPTITINGKSNIFMLNAGKTSTANIVLHIPMPDEIAVTADPVSLQGGQTVSNIYAQLKLNGENYSRPNIAVIFNSDNDTIGTLPSVKTTFTNFSGIASIPITATGQAGIVNVTALSEIAYQSSIGNGVTVFAYTDPFPVETPGHIDPSSDPISSVFGNVVDSFNTGYGGVEVKLHIMRSDDTELYYISKIASSSQPYAGSFVFDNIQLTPEASYAYISSEAVLTDHLTIFGRSDNLILSPGSTSSGSVVLHVPLPDSVVLTADPDPFNAGGDVSTITAQMYLNGMPYKRPGIMVNFNDVNPEVAYLPEAKTAITDIDGKATIQLTSAKTLGTARVTASSNIAYNTVIQDYLDVHISRWGTITVGPDSGYHFNNIQAAIDAAVDGDKILVYSGTYNENINVYKTLNLTGMDNGGGKPVIDGGNNGIVIVALSGTGGIKFDNFVVKNMIDTGVPAIDVYSQNNIISNNIVENSDYAIHGYYTSNILIKNNVLYNNKQAINLDNCYNTTIDGNIVHDNTEWGIIVINSDLTRVNNNDIYNEINCGIHIYQSDDCEILFNDVTNCNNGIPISESNNCLVKNNNVQNTQNGQGISVYRSAGISIIENTVTNNNWCGIWLDSSNNIIVQNNDANFNGFSTGGCGIGSRFSNNSAFIENMVNNNLGRGISISEDSNYNNVSFNNVQDNVLDGIILWGDCDVNIVSDNYVSGNFEGINCGFSRDNIISNNIASDNRYRGLYFDTDINITIINNTAYSNDIDGISIRSSNYSTIKENVANNNIESGISLWGQSDTINILNNTANYNNIGIAAGYSDNNILKDNILKNNRWTGIWLDSVTNISVINNTADFNGFTDNGGGIAGRYVNYSRIINNTANNNFNIGIGLWEICIYNNLSLNSVMNNEWDGLIVHNKCRNNDVINNIAINNSNGISIYDSNINTIYDNQLKFNRNSGIWLDTVNDSIIYDNIAIGNDGGIYSRFIFNNQISNNFVNDSKHDGINLWNDCKNNFVKDNIAINNSNGIAIGYSNSNTISNNKLLNNTDNGIWLDTVNDTIISNNNASGNFRGINSRVLNNDQIKNNFVNDSKNDGINLWDSCNDNQITDNIAINNGNMGISTGYSNRNTITGNQLTCNYYDGLWLDSVNNYIISSNNASFNKKSGLNCQLMNFSTINDNIAINNNECGISFYNLESCNIYGNNGSYNGNKDYGYGINIYMLGNNTFSNNIALNNTGEGIEIGSLLNNTISDNSIYNCPYGLYLYGDELKLRNNIMSNNWYNFYGPTGLNNDIDTSNLVDGKPIIYLYNRNGISLDSSSNAGTIYAIYCDDIRIKDIALRNNSFGILFYNTKNSKIENVNTFYNDYGIGLFSSTNNEVYNNQLSNNNYGILIQSSNNNILRNNIMTNNLYNYGDWVTSSPYNNVDHSNTVNGKPVHYSIGEYNKVYDQSSDIGSLHVLDGYNITVKGMTLNNNYNGIAFFNTRFSTINDCQVNDNARGISLLYSSNNNISQNNASNCLSSMYITRSNNNDIFNNKFLNNKWGALYLYYNYGNILTENSFKNNYFAIYARNDNSNGNDLQYNQIYLNDFSDNSYTNAFSYGQYINWNSTYPITYKYNNIETTFNLGNYWSNYTGIDTGTDGIGDIAHIQSIRDSTFSDNYPLISTASNYDIINSPEGPTTIYLTADPSYILQGGDTTLISAQLYMNSKPYKVPGITVEFLSDNNTVGYLPAFKTAVTDDNGVATILLTSNKRGEVNVTAKLFSDYTQTMVTSNVKVYVVEWGAISGIITDMSGKGIPGAIVRLNYYGTNSPVMSPDNPQVCNDGRTALSGVYTFSRIPTGKYTVSVEKDGHTATATADLKIGTETCNIVIDSYDCPDGESFTIPAASSNGYCTLYGLVVDKNKNAIRGANVTLWQYAYDPVIGDWANMALAEVSSNPQKSSHGVDSPEGEYAFYSVPQGTYNVTAELSGRLYYAIAVLDSDRVCRYIVIPDFVYMPPNLPEDLSGIVLDRNMAGVPLSTVTLWNCQYNPVSGQWEKTTVVAVLNNPQLSDDGSINETGTFIFGSIPSGKYIVEVEKDGNQNSTLMNIDGDPYTPNYASIILSGYEYVPPASIGLTFVEVTQPEGTDCQIWLYRNGDTSVTSTVRYIMSPGTIPGHIAIAGQDYYSVSDMLTFMPGETGKAIWVKIVDDGLKEDYEIFRITLVSPVNADIELSYTDCIIKANDPLGV